jgi:hypothetical protein
MEGRRRVLVVVVIGAGDRHPDVVVARRLVDDPGD